MSNTGLILDHGDFTIKQSPTGIRVIDGAGTITTPNISGVVTYVRSPAGGILYIDRVEVGRHYTPCKGSMGLCFFYGTGSIKNLKMFNRILSATQAVNL